MRLLAPALLGALCLAACTRVSVPTTSDDPVVELQTIPQNFAALGLAMQLAKSRAPAKAERSFDEYLKTTFLLWDEARPFPTRDALERAASERENSYGENLLLRSDTWLRRLVAQSNLAQLAKTGTRGVVTRTTDLRSLPTMQPAFRRPTLPGEGYPFDYLQVSQLRVGAPVLVSHLSRDGNWVFVETIWQGNGWVAAHDVVSLTKEESEKYRQSSFAILTTDDEELLDANGRVVATSTLGALLPVQSATEKELVLLVPRAGEQRFVAATVSRSLAIDRPWSLSDGKAVGTAVEKLLGKPYGWGGIGGARDCSLLVQDFYALFGVRLPSYSRSQLRHGKLVDLKGMTHAQKRDAIRTHGSPFRSLLFRPGHVGIYAGLRGDEPLFFHSYWGVRTKREGQEGRALVAKVVVTRLDFERREPSFDPVGGTFLDHLETLVQLDGVN